MASHRITRSHQVCAPLRTAWALCSPLLLLAWQHRRLDDIQIIGTDRNVAGAHPVQHDLVIVTAVGPAAPPSRTEQASRKTSEARWPSPASISDTLNRRQRPIERQPTTILCARARAPSLRRRGSCRPLPVLGCVDAGTFEQLEKVRNVRSWGPRGVPCTDPQASGGLAGPRYASASSVNNSTVDWQRHAPAMADLCIIHSQSFETAHDTELAHELHQALHLQNGRTAANDGGLLSSVAATGLRRWGRARALVPFQARTRVRDVYTTTRPTTLGPNSHHGDALPELVSAASPTTSLSADGARTRTAPAGVARHVECAEQEKTARGVQARARFASAGRPSPSPSPQPQCEGPLPTHPMRQHETRSGCGSSTASLNLHRHLYLALPLTSPDMPRSPPPC